MTAIDSVRNFSNRASSSQSVSRTLSTFLESVMPSLICCSFCVATSALMVFLSRSLGAAIVNRYQTFSLKQGYFGSPLRRVRSDYHSGTLLSSLCNYVHRQAFSLFGRVHVLLEEA